MEKETIEKIEADNLCPVDGRIPPVPFGFGHDKWLAFKSRMQPGDEIYYYSSSIESWQNLAGRSGYVMVRAGEVVATFDTILN